MNWNPDGTHRSSGRMDPYSLLITHQLVSFKRLYVAGIYSPSFLYDRIVGDVYILKAGETIIMPAKKPYAVYGEERFKICIYRKYICKYRFFLVTRKIGLVS